MGTRRSSSPPPDRLAAVLGEVDRARRGGWVPGTDAMDTSPRGPSRSRHRTSDPASPRHRRTEETVRPHAPLVRTPSSLQGAQVGPSRLAVVAVVVLVAAAAVVLGGRMLLVRSSAQPQPARGPLPEPVAATASSAWRGAEPGSRAGRSSTPTSAVGAATAVSGPVFVHVVGQVTRPGVVRLSAGARVQDALSAAGGPGRSADLSKVNLARPVVDGEQVVVPRPGESVEAAPMVGSGGAPGGPAGPAAAAPGGGTSAAPGAPGAPVDLNTADAGGLDALPGIGPVIAARIVQWRTDNGRFSSVEELTEVSGIGDKLMEQLRPLVRV